MVLALHAALLWSLWQHRSIPTPQEAVTLFVSLIAPPAPEKKAEPEPPPPKPKPVEKPRPIEKPRQLVAETTVVAPTDLVAPPPAPEPVIEAPAASAASPAPALPVGPVTLGNELSVACPERTLPRYPPASRRLGEEGLVVLRVELDESGRVDLAGVQTGSGHARLDEAALAAVKTWRCTPARRDGRPVRAVAWQPFKFVLQGS